MNLLSGLIITLLCAHSAYQQILSTPVVAILTLHTSPKFEFPDGTSYMYTSYSKWVEQSEMRWIPISVDDSPEVIKKKLEKVNGALLTGGNEVLGTRNLPSQYAVAVRTILEFSIQAYKQGISFPVFGTCMGFEAMMTLLTDYEVQLEKVDNENQTLGLDFSPKAKTSYLSLYFTVNQLESINSQKLFYFHHRDGFSVAQVEKSAKAKQNLDIVATVITPQKTKIVAVFQHKTYPFIAVQFHPEKIQFEYSDNYVINKSELSVQVNSGFSKILRRLIGGVQAKLSTKEVLEFRAEAKIEIEFGAADEAFVFQPKLKGAPEKRRIVNVDEVSAN